jgi:hypothetical protein
VPEMLERPFIPSSTPMPPRATASATEFHLARPFVHGATMAAPGTTGPVSSVSLPSIDEFLETTPGRVESYASPVDALDFTGAAQNSYDLPPVEHFLDPLPLVDALAPDGRDMVVADARETNVGDEATGEYQTQGSEMFGVEETGWVDTGWQQFDWSRAAALGEGAAEASDAWRETDWDTTAAPANDFRETAAQAIANALNDIANRIRNGELVVPPPSLVTDPAAIAATLAALLGVRR